ncbi:MAG: TlpA family protein disulfide reductase [Verrucomicrobia bacterium]|nr:TlpA family protein disulfide reductase [Verrucomicrobiota bacterium]
MKRLAGKPFALLGVNSDPKERLKAVIQKERMTWRSWWDGGSTEGTIATQWGVEGWPTLYVIDHRGIIRQKYVGSPGDDVLDRVLDDLIRQTEREAIK